MDEQLFETRAQQIADRFALQLLWANFLRFTGDTGSVARLSAESIETMEDTVTRGTKPEDAEAITHHLETFWQGVADQLRPEN